MTLESYPAMKQITKTLEERDEENIIGLRIIYFENTIWPENLQLKKKVNREIHIYDDYYYYYYYYL